MTFDNTFKLGIIQQIPLLDGNAIPKRLESLRRANKCRYRMTVFDRPPNDLQPRAPGGTQYNQLHAGLRSRTLSAFGLSADVASHISYRLLYSIKDATISPSAENKKASLQIAGSGAPGRRHPPTHRRSHQAALAERRLCRNDHRSHRAAGGGICPERVCPVQVEDGNSHGTS